MKSIAYIAIFVASVARISLAMDPELAQVSITAEDPTPCETCIRIVRDVEAYLENPQTQDTVVSFIQTNICSLMPEDAARTCKQEARVLVAQLVASLEQSWPPEVVCQRTGMCDASVDFSRKGSMQTGTVDMDGQGWRKHIEFPGECPICKLLANTLEQRLRDPVMRKQIYDSAMSVCRGLVDMEEVTKCCGEVDNLFSSVDALIDDMDPEKACRIMQFCGDGNNAEGRTPGYGGSDTLKDLRASRMSHAATKSDSSPDADNCDACKHVIEEIDALLMVSCVPYVLCPFLLPRTDLENIFNPLMKFACP